MSDLDQMLAAQAAGPSGLQSSSDPLDSMLASRAAAPAGSPAVQAGQSINADVNSIPRQIGLTARYGLEGLANTAQIVTEPIRHGLSWLSSSIPMLGENGNTNPLMMTRQTGAAPAPLGQGTSSLLNSAGLPAPQTADERVVGDATRLVAGAGGLGGAARALSAVPGLVGQAGEFLSANMPSQLSSAAGAGLLGGASREAGGGAGTQATAALAGGVLGGLVPGAVNGAVNAVKSFASRPNPQQLDQQISVVLQRANVDWNALPDAAKNSLRKDIAGALNTGQDLNQDALRRLADFRTVGATPTRGAITQDPVQITKEMNLAKTAANTSDGQLQGLPRIQNQNNATLIRNLNGAGAAQGDMYGAGQSTIGAILGRDAQMQGNVSQLYQAARDSAGRPLPLNGAAFATKANQAIDEAMLGYALPSSVQTRMNQIASGEVPFNIDFAEQFKKNLNHLYGATQDGATRRALSTVSRALDETPLVSAPTVNPGNLPAVAGTVPPSPMQVGQQARQAFSDARAAARERFVWQDSGQPVKAALNGAEPDNFINRFVVRGTVADAQNIADNAPREQVRSAISNYLKREALNGAADEVGKFSQSSYNKALGAIGDRKLGLFFSPQEMQQLHAVGRVASYTQVQPVGSAVNNSNSGAMLLGRGYDALKGIAAKLPGGQSLLLNPLNNIEVSLQNKNAQNVIPGLLTPIPRRPVGQGLLLPAAALGGLLAAPPP